MLRNKTLWFVLSALTAIVFCYGVSELLIMRFERGDVYRPYSSFRSDPLGTKIFYEALRLQREIKVSRNIEPLTRMETPAGKTLFLFGIDLRYLAAMDKDRARALEDFVKGGGRLVIAFAPTKDNPPAEKKKENETCKTDPSNENDEKDEAKKEGPGPDGKDVKKENTNDDEEEKEEHKTSLDLAEEWSFELKLSPNKDNSAVLSSEEDLPRTLPWRTTLIFEPDETQWDVLYRREGKPVFIERTMGAGSILVSSDSYVFSNEAMKKDRYPGLLSYLCGQGGEIVFDETHLGVERQYGIAGLLRKYGLAPFIGSLVLLALLAIWRRSVVFVPTGEEERVVSVAADRDYAAGLTNLLQRNIGNGEIIDVCLEEWKRSFTHGRRDYSDRLPAIEAIVKAEKKKPARQRNAVKVYRRIGEAVRR